MTDFLLTIDEETAAGAPGFEEVFLWTRSAPSTFTGTLDPHLEAFGPVRPENVDFVRLALGVFSADRSVRRASRGADWNARDITLTVEVGNPSIWQEQAEELAEVVGFLTGDRWSFTFTQAPSKESDGQLPIDPPPTTTVLLSGGADSATGALVTALDLPKGSTLQLVSHFSANAVSPFQTDLVNRIQQLVPGRTIVHRQNNLNRRARRPDGSRFPSESSNRSRSLLFLALGLAAAERSGQTLLIPENGFASLNPPLGAERRGALSTHTTHPRFLRDLVGILAKVGAHGAIHNPFELMTKGEMFAEVARRIGKTEASNYLSATNSCSHTDARYSGASAGAQCGVCFGCLMRRASFHAAEIEDRTEYLCNDPANRFAEFVAQKSIIEAMRDFATEDPKPSMVMTMSLPSDYAPEAALDLCQRGIAELRAFLP
ncbi:hypothetical protein [Mycolicibacterium alvei]|uniref:7-cyano-7-deazaguanine synthase n=1 Tax=Mycolicibacterium alvei TaxID=67081 RepID=A0A6N4UJP2_9MYCO|nr:hypothetical protein [Mycolicibacterium alvei]MCV6998783.1 hypothetical protein [Mycolicibacterium alvei]BBX25030.1 hypothetical protein MALV_01550 [Mycolicibacterium alvei]